MKQESYIFLLICFFSISNNAQNIETLRNEIMKNISSKKATVGLSICGENENDTLTINGAEHLPMQSVFKFHIALVVLSEIDKGKFKLNQKIKISKQELLPDTWSPIREKYPNGTTLKLSEILKYTVAESDNNGCDLLVRLLGGINKVNSYFENQNIKEISIKANEEEMHKSWEIQFTN